MAVTSFGETSKPAFFSFRILYEGVANLSLWASTKPSYITHSFPYTQGSCPTFFSRHVVHLLCKSNAAIMWPQEPFLCPLNSPSEAMTLYKQYNQQIFQKYSLRTHRKINLFVS